ncbi:MAG TPA: VOC family protein [Stackebrandtia sp.]|jgi:predicted enzyme related to lactoylglutathione lyase|uniref:VOC family protein n=1 Tax=Stackebrandtia sp. TaxID=2023065 RepID=UPI002D339F65|nr:VOC family protein [Stackebrandtia sp.]HZE37453.1 VOC family protein [Stackebrandtia sp.]
MPTFVKNIAFDCADAYELARFWSRVLQHPMLDDDRPGDPETAVLVPDGANFYFQQVPEAKVVKNRLHVCLSPDIGRDAEVERVRELGATIVDDCRNPDGTGWVVCADPEGNEFCVLRNEEERHAHHSEN